MAFMIVMMLNSQHEDLYSPSLICFRICSRCIGLIFGPVRKSIRYNVNYVRGSRALPVQSGVKLFTPYRIDMFWIGNIRFKSNLASVQESDNEIPFKNGTHPLNSSFTSGAERSKKLSDTERITFGIGEFQVLIVTKIVPDQLDQV